MSKMQAIPESTDGNPADLTLAQMAAALRAGQLSSVALVRAFLTRIADRDPQIGAFVHVDRDGALAAAAAADVAFAGGQDNGPLQGIPVAIKDVIDVAGWPVRWGSSLWQHRVAAQDAAVVKNLREQGAVLLGVVATYEMATVGPDPSSLYAQPRNPWNADHITGGSSSGSAAAVAGGMAPVALGTDTGGSVRSPAAFCGVVGFKPTFDRFPMEGVMPLSQTLDHIGLLTQTAEDAAFAMTAMAGMPAPEGQSEKLRVGFVRNWCDAQTVQAYDKAASDLSLIGASVTLVDLPDYTPLEDAACEVLLYEQVRNHWSEISRTPDQVGHMLLDTMQAGRGVDDQTYTKGQAVAQDFAQQAEAAMAKFDVLILPTTLCLAERFDSFEDGKATWTPMRTIPFNMSGQPAISIPVGLQDGMPLGLQIVGARHDDMKVLQVAQMFERATDHSCQKPDFRAVDIAAAEAQ
ncbi:amidase [Sulfitobacter mediterraneus]|uniref:amidase n=1 Tax=Sulfitobacter mediterraneus TaxID=83219 RepID=UPI0013C3F33F|nr:amidase [Sulfitobacter mediterraneus]